MLARRLFEEIVVGLLVSAAAFGAYKPTTPAPVPAGAVEVKAPGNLDKPGTTYVLTADVKSASGVFCLQKDVTLDLNGHTVEYASAAYEHVPNGGFETGDIEPWDATKAPGARVVECDKARPFIGKFLCVLPQGEELVSPLINLPVANRTYYAMCGVTDTNRAVLISVEDEKGNPVTCAFKFADKTRPCCPQQGSPKLGGGFVFAQIFGQPAGKYRIRVKCVKGPAEVDEIDIRPAMDAGIAIVDKVFPWAYYKCIHDADYAAFFDLTKPGSSTEPMEGVPRVTGEGTITIRNGVIRSGFEGIRSWGVQSTAAGVKVKLENVRFEASGINTNAVDVPMADIKDCLVDVHTPFIIDRHRIADMAVNLAGPGASMVTDSEFLGGQGCLSIHGAGTEVANCRLVNRQTVTNHYSIAAHQDGLKIHDCRFEPEIGSGIEIFRGSHCEIYGNVFKIVSAPPNCEYRFSDYSTNAVRVTDYDAKPGAPGVCANNRIHDNKFFITGKEYPQFDKYLPMAYGLFVSVGGGTTYASNNEFVVDQQGGKQSIACAVYIGGSSNGGEYVGNRITTNCPAFWVASRYGKAANVLIKGNTITRAADAKEDFAPFEFGWWQNAAKDVRLVSNTLKGLDFDVFLNTYSGVDKSAWSVGWTLKVSVVDAAGKPVAGEEVKVRSASGRETVLKTDDKGVASADLVEFTAMGNDRTAAGPYQVTARGATETVEMKSDKAVTLTLK